MPIPTQEEYILGHYGADVYKKTFSKDAPVTANVSGKKGYYEGDIFNPFKDTSAPAPKPEPAAPLGIVTSTPVKQDIAERGQDPAVTDFKNEAEYEKFKERVEPTNGKPVRPSVADEYTTLQKEYGTATLDEDINKNIEEQDKLVAGLETFKQKETGGESQAFYAGRISEEEGYTQTRLTALQNREKILRNRLDTKNKTIDSIMKLNEYDYEKARGEYEFEYNKNLAITQAYSTEKDRQVTADKAAYNTIYNMFTNSGKTMDEFMASSPGIGQKMNELELKTGIPVGTFAALAKSKPKATVIQSGVGADASGNEFAWMITQGEDGTPSITKIPTGGFKKVTPAPEDRLDTVTDFLTQKKGDDHKISAKDYEEGLRKWIAANGTQTNYFSSFPREQWMTEQEAKNLSTELKTTEAKKTQSVKDTDIPSMIETLNKAITGGKVTREQLQTMIDSGKIVSKGITYELTDSQKAQIQKALRSTWQKIIPGGR